MPKNKTKGTRKKDNKTNKHEFACNAGKVTEYEVKEHIDTIMVGFRGFSKEVSIVKWNDKKPVFDIRAWRVSDRDGLQYPLRKSAIVLMTMQMKRTIHKQYRAKHFSLCLRCLR